MRIIPILFLLLLLGACADEITLEDQGYVPCDDAQRLRAAYMLRRINEVGIEQNGSLIVWRVHLDTAKDEDGKTWCRYGKSRSALAP